MLQRSSTTGKLMRAANGNLMNGCRCDCEPCPCPMDGAASYLIDLDGYVCGTFEDAGLPEWDGLVGDGAGVSAGQPPGFCGADGSGDCFWYMNCADIYKVPGSDIRMGTVELRWMLETDPDNPCCHTIKINFNLDPSGFCEVWWRKCTGTSPVGTYTWWKTTCPEGESCPDPVPDIYVT